MPERGLIVALTCERKESAAGAQVDGNDSNLVSKSWKTTKTSGQRMEGTMRIALGRMPLLL